MNSLEVRVSDFSRFPRIAASFIRALEPENMSMKEALEIPTQRMQKAAKAPGNSFEDQVETLNGTQPYIYYAYYPNQYHDGVSWTQLMIIFPLEGCWDEETGIVDNESQPKVQDRDEDQSTEYEGYYSTDDFEHLQVYATETPRSSWKVTSTPSVPDSSLPPSSFRSASR